MRYPVEYIVIERDTCTRTFGVGECKATGTKCYNTIGTCKFLEAYDNDKHNDIFIKSENAGAEIYASLGDAVYPFVRSISHKPATINPASAKEGSTALGTRASVTISLMDAASDDRYQDPYFFERDQPNLLGSFFTKYFARNEYLWGRKLKWVAGYVEGGAIVKERVKEYLITDIDGVDAQGNVTITAQDALVMTNQDKAEWPKPTAAIISLDVDEQQTTINVIPSVDDEGRQGTDISEWPAQSYIRIDDEIMHYSSINGLALTVTRGELGTTAESHSADSTIQLVGSIENLEPQEVIYKILSEGTDIPAEMLDLDQWNDETNLKPWLIRKYTAHISEPTSVRKLLADAARQMGFFPYPDEHTNKIRIKGSTAQADYNPAVIELNETENFIADTFSVRSNDADVITRLNAQIGVRNWAADLDDSSNYRTGVLLVTGEERPARRGYSRAADLHGYFLTAEQAVLMGRQILRQFAKANQTYSFSLDVKDAVQLADFATINHRLVVNEHGERETRNALITRVTENPETGRLDVVATYYPELEQQDEEGAYTVLIPINATNVVLTELFAQERPGVTLENGDKVTFLWGAGVAVGSTSTEEVSLDTGVFPQDVELEIKCSVKAFVIGKGGCGGDGGSIGVSGSGFPAGDGEDGGDALIVRHPLTITGPFVIGGGGGGGGGGASMMGTDLNPTTRASGGGGGSGAGFEESDAGQGGSIQGQGDFADYYGLAGKKGSVENGGDGGSGVGFGVVLSGDGGRGGNLGQNGSNGGEGSQATGGGGQGGQAGAAVQAGNELIISATEATFLGARNDT